MRQTVIALTTLLTVVSCNTPDTTKLAIDTTIVHSMDNSESSRRILIEELKKLQQNVTSKDKEKIADIFVFPLSDTSFNVYMDDSTFDEQFTMNGHKTTKPMFLQYFKEISESTWLDQLGNLFQQVPLDSLLFKNVLEHDSYIEAEPCYYSYKLEVIKDSIVLRMDMNSNRNYKSKKSSEDDIPENSSEICEHSFWWNFRFDGKKLSFDNIGGAD